MTRPADHLRCMYCGRYVATDDLDAGRAEHVLVEPDSAFGAERWETYHVACKRAAEILAGDVGREKSAEHGSRLQ